MKRVALGIDIGGTKVAFALINRDGELLAESEIATLPDEGAEAVIGRIADEANRHIASVNGDIDGVGIGTPGWIDAKQGIVKNAVNLGWLDVPLVEMLQARLPKAYPVRLAVDVHAILTGEAMFGAAKGHADVVQLAVGTGLGGAALTGGHLVTGGGHFAMEMGHWHTGVNPERLCNCGNRGCAEMTLSGRGVVAGIEAHRALYSESPLAQKANPTPHDWLDALRSDDPLSLHILEDMRETLARVIGACGSVLNPSYIVLSGGLGLAIADLLLADLDTRLKPRALEPIHAHLKVKKSALQNSTIGAAALVWSD